MAHKSLHALRREARANAWRVYASIMPFEGQARLVINAMRESGGGATELTSTTYLLADAEAATAAANRQALALGCTPATIVWGPPIVAAEAAARLRAAVAA